MSDKDEKSIKTYMFYETPGHGYLRVPKADLIAVGMSKDWDFCPYYDRGNSVEIEEDDDMPEFIKRITEAGWNFKIKRRKAKDDRYILDCVLCDSRDKSIICTRTMSITELNRLNQEARDVGEIYLVWHLKIHHKFEWSVVSTALQYHVLMLRDALSGAYGIVRKPTKDEWARSFFAPSNPYRWDGGDYRVEILKPVRYSNRNPQTAMADAVLKRMEQDPKTAKLFGDNPEVFITLKESKHNE